MDIELLCNNKDQYNMESMNWNYEWYKISKFKNDVDFMIKILNNDQD